MSHPPLGLTVRANMVRVIDGDTLEVEVRWPAVIRLLDCWSPERYTEDGQAAKLHLEQMLHGPSRQVVVNIPSSSADSLGDLLTFGRALGDVWIPGDDLSLSELMVDSGHATKEKR